MSAPLVPRKFVLFLALVVTLFAAASARAQTVFTWAGPGDGQISNPSNWVGGVAPTGAGGEDLVFNVGGTHYATFSSSFTVRDLTFGPSAGYYDLSGTGGAVLTITGEVDADLGSFTPIVFNVPIALTSGTHIFSGGSIEVPGAPFYLYGAVGGPGGIDKYGRGYLYIVHPDNTYTGGTRIFEGVLVVYGDNALGSGTVSMNGGSLVGADFDFDGRVTVLANDFSLSNHVYFGEYFGTGSLTLTGVATAQGGLEDGKVHVHVDGNGLLTLGDLGETDAGTVFAFDSPGAVRITGVSSYTGGTQVSDEGLVVFAGDVPAVGSLLVTENGYIGSEQTTNIQSHFLDHFDKANSTGIVGFDSPIVGSPQDFNEDIDLTGFDSSVRLGTSTSARLNGNITPQGSAYQFGGRGLLTVTSALTGFYSLTASDHLVLTLTGSNNYTSFTSAQYGGAIIFAGYSAVPGETYFIVDDGSYIGMTESVPMAANSFIAKFSTSFTSGVIGFDADNPNTGRFVEDSIDLSAFSSTPFLGTSTYVTLAGSITPANGEYRFAGFHNGQLVVDSVLTGSNNVRIGLDPSYVNIPAPRGEVYNPSVTLNSANDFSGTLTLQSGRLIVGNNNALGANVVSVLSGAKGLATSTDGIVIGNGFAFSDTTSFELYGTHDFHLTGNLSGSNGALDKVDVNTVILSGDNSGLNFSINVYGGEVQFDTDTAAGNGTLALYYRDGVNDGQAAFTSANPVVGTLYGASGTTLDLGTGNLSIFQNEDTRFDGVIIGTGGIIKQGGATLTLGSANGYAGNTMLVAGTLVAGHDGSLGSGTIVFNGGRLSVAPGVTLTNPISFGASGGTLGGNGTFGGPVTIGDQVDLSPGNSVGLLNFTGGLTWAPSGTFDLEIQYANGGRGVGYDSIDVTGGLTFNATLGTPFTLNLISLDASGANGDVSDFNSASGYTWLIAHTDGITGFDAAAISLNSLSFTNSLGANGTFSVSAVGNDVFLNFSPVPEPSTYALLAGGLAWLALGFWRRR